MRVVQAELIKLKTDDGLWEMQDHIKLGKIYKVDLHTAQMMRAFNRVQHVFHEREMVKDVVFNEWIPFEFLKILE